MSYPLWANAASIRREAERAGVPEGALADALRRLPRDEQLGLLAGTSGQLIAAAEPFRRDRWTPEETLRFMGFGPIVRSWEE